VVIRRLVVGVIIDCFVDLNTLLVVIKDILKHWDDLSDSAEASAISAPFKAL
jgi:hypothetical protein